MRRERRGGGGQAGTAYVEYFIAAAAAAAATLAVASNLDSIRGQIDGRFNGQMNAIAGPVQ